MVERTEVRNPVDLLGEEFVRRRRRGEQITVEEFASGHPDLADQIRRVFPAILALEHFKSSKHHSSPHAHAPLEASLEGLDQLGDYRIIREIGRGGMGVVFEAEQQTLSRRVAVKVFPGQALIDQRSLDRFHREAKMAASLHHTNIVPVFGFGEQDDLHYYVMQRIKGTPLDQVIQTFAQCASNSSWLRRVIKPAAPSNSTARLAAQQCDTRPDVGVALDPPVAFDQLTTHSEFDWKNHAIRSGRSEWHAIADIGIQVASALAYAHAQGVLHRDIKPSNLLLDAQGTVWVTDFGLATIMEAEKRDQVDEVAGTLRFMAPEHIAGKQDARSDIYSLGLTLYELLTRQPAFDDLSRTSLVSKIMAGAMIPPRAIRPDIPADLQAIVLKATSQDPEHRYVDADAMAGDLRRFVAGRTIAARRAGPLLTLVRWTRRNPTVATLTAALIALAICSFALVSSKWRDAVAENQRAEGNLSLALESMDQILERFASGWMAHPAANEAGVDSESGTELEFQIVVSDHNAAVLQNALVFYDRFEKHNPTDPRLRYETSKVHRRVGDIYRRLGQHDRAESAYRRSLTYVRNSPGDRDLEQTLELASTRNHLGLSLYRASQFEEAKSEFHLALDELEQSPHRSTPECRTAQASTLTNLAQCLSRMFRQRGALQRQQQAVEIIEKIVQEQDTENSSHRLALALAYRGFFTLASSHRRPRSDKPDVQHLEEIRTSGVRILEQLVMDYPNVPDYRCELSDMLATTGFRKKDGPLREQRVADLQRSVALARELSEDHPSIPRYRAVLARALKSLARLRRETAPDVSVQLFDESIALYRSLTREFSDIPAYRIFLVWTLRDQVNNLRSMGRDQESLLVIQDAIDEQNTYLQLRPGNHFGKVRLGYLYKELAEVYEQLHQDVQADTAWQEAEKLLHKRFGRKPVS